MVTRIEMLKARAELSTLEKRKKRGRKQPSAAPPTLWWRSPVTKRPFKLKKTAEINAADEWLYRADFGEVVGQDMWSWTDLERQGCTQLDGQPDDWELAERRQPKEVKDSWE
jgi:hypothetical protein